MSSQKIPQSQIRGANASLYNLTKIETLVYLLPSTGVADDVIALTPRHASQNQHR